MSNLLTHRLGAIVAAELQRADISENTAALRTGISRQTLRRRLASGDFTSREITAIADLLGTHASLLMARAEGAA